MWVMCFHTMNHQREWNLTEILLSERLSKCAQLSGYYTYLRNVSKTGTYGILPGERALRNAHAL